MSLQILLGSAGHGSDATPYITALLSFLGSVLVAVVSTRQYRATARSAARTLDQAVREARKNLLVGQLNALQAATVEVEFLTWKVMRAEGEAPGRNDDNIIKAIANLRVHLDASNPAYDPLKRHLAKYIDASDLANWHATFQELTANLITKVNSEIRSIFQSSSEVGPNA